MLTVGTHFSYGFVENFLAGFGALRVEMDHETGLPTASLRAWHPLTWAALVAVALSAAWNASGGFDERATAARDAWAFYRGWTW